MISLEVPKTFDELFEVFRGFFAFAICFAILFVIWNNQNIFFRRYGLNNAYITFLNGLLMFVVLMYVYPLKFLFTLLLSQGVYNNHGHMMAMITDQQLPALMYVYHSGYAAIYILFFLMHLHARKKAAELDLSPAELFETDTFIIINLFNGLLGITGILLVAFLPATGKDSTGVIYITIPLIYTILFSWRGKISRRRFGEIIEQPS